MASHNVQIVIYRDQNENYCVGFNIPSEGNCDGHSIIASKFSKGGYHEPFHNVPMSDWIRTIYISVSDGSFVDLDARDLENIKVDIA